jgi:pyrimidine-nucleoside phosphorylase/thymidine phosphorylase
MVDIIHKKKNGQALTREEIEYVVNGYTAGDIPDYQVSALLMAICFQGMNEQETADLTQAMTNSGDKVDLSAIEGVKVDKHSTGGVGDKISVIVAPLVAAVGVPVAKMSGRGLGHTGGTVDKLESIPGFQIELTKEQFIEHVNKIKIALVGQSGNLAPADKKLYALRDVTGTVESIPLIASSIMSKKVASGADSIVLDVKVGKGAFMKTLDQARALAQAMVNIGSNLGRKTVAVITDMNQPLGYEVGNANEIKEAIEVLKGKEVKDLSTIALTIASHMTVLGGIYSSYDEAYSALLSTIQSGRAIDKLKEFIEAQGGDPAVVDHPERLPQAQYAYEVKAEASGYVTGIDAEKVGIAAMLLGAGRRTKEDTIDYSAGVTLCKKIGDRVTAGDTLCVMHTNKDNAEDARSRLISAYSLGSEKPEEVQYVYEVIGEE